jgi:O-antigen ligase
MSRVGRAGWWVAAALFATLLSSIVHVDFVGVVPEALLLAFAAICAMRPAAGLEIACALIPVAYVLSVQHWNWRLPWAELVAMAAIVGLSIDAARGKADRRVPFALAAPALLFGLVVAGSMIASLGVPVLRLGPAFVDALRTQLLRQYFVDLRSFPALHTGMLLLEGILLFALSARIAVGREGFLRRVAAAAAIGAVLAAAMNIARLLQAAARSDTFWSTLALMSHTLRWNVHYTDYNAAGSYFAMTTLVALAIALVAPRRARWIAAGLTLAAAMYLTGSRAAYAAAVVAFAGAMLMHRMGASRRRLAALAAVTIVALGVLVAIATVAPHRGNQQSSLTAVDVRIEMAKVGGRMIARYPAFGIGLGEFSQRSGEYSPIELFQKFPVAIHENAHNNFVQIAAELGLVGGALFAWLIVAGLFVAAHGVHADMLRLFVLAALASFVITWLAGHPLLVPEPAYIFWILLGVAAGSACAPRLDRADHDTREGTPARRWIVAACFLAIAATVPWRMRAMMRDADLEHIGVGLSVWRVSEDGSRYREAEGHATLFVPSGGFRLGVNPRTDGAVRMELRLDGRVADVMTLVPRQWNEINMPARSEVSRARYSRLDVRLADAPDALIWITKVQAVDTPGRQQPR